jgi:UDPglucose 6-dehydrogenase
LDLEAPALKRILAAEQRNLKLTVLSNPEILAEGTAIRELLNADRVLIGGEPTEAGQNAIASLSEIYEAWIPKERIIATNIWSSELSKLTANAFLAQRISSINAISALCEKTEANVDEVAKAIGADSRIGSKFLKASVGFGGSCFKKDILNLVYLCRHFGIDEAADYWEQVIKMNDFQKQRFAENIVNALFNTVSGKKIVFYGWAFKKDTNDTRESAAIEIADKLIEEQAIIHAYDPKVKQARMIEDLNYLNTRTEEENEKHLNCETDPYKAADGAHAIAVITEWDEFTGYDWKRIYNSMKKPAFLFDGRNILDHDALREIGFEVRAIGR